ncbi:DUF2093 domain-containing protein [Candidatus Liberibacter asiaticus]|uniref:DUF2093 domain-containing protein n=2 Tax=Liberibacter asiaticus TaxID=34021 RepID=C6XHY0_LIBAP|nr:DUF2093 domain-containing protein [Candidatus Liberibacter asiaticus]ACT56873.1 hypothetical protein CLIBASIA_01425 [Candidatus Liberibacter asiaticus str. psy62]AGH16637.1 hypothetical protein WSI_01335 [Candidatus Liberibacter asiaticus str. gxpsy]ALK07025.1 DUF2093 domain-containing protein [Candidatus Liberibacter asiaticus]ASK52495.1 hypothetical protein B2I23_01370 [Candidatus Liberibacter asiaticus]AWL13819.1 DUF2093 domain-containing protein [Candidatus Liberibacter asiaticus]
MYNKVDENEASIRYKDGTFEIIRPGTYVVCAITGQRIPLKKLCYWSVDRQVPYANAEASFEAEKISGKIPY